MPSASSSHAVITPSPSQGCAPSNCGTIAHPQAQELPLHRRGASSNCPGQLLHWPVPPPGCAGLTAHFVEARAWGGLAGPYPLSYHPLAHQRLPPAW